MTNYKTIGQPRPLIDGRPKVTGETRFTADVNLPGMLHARLVTSLYAHAAIRRVDTAAALKVPGVVMVLTAADLPDIPPASRNKLLLARGRVVFMGQPVALVVAASEAAAEDGAQQVSVDYQPLPAAITLDEALADGAPLVWPDGIPSDDGDAGAHGADVSSDKDDTATFSNISGEESYERGDLAAGFAAADAVVERTYTTPFVHQSSIETHSVVAQPDPASAGAQLWSSTQTPFGVRKGVAEILGVPETDVRVTGMAVGGGFGAKFGIYDPLVALAAGRTGRPVKLVLTRSEELLATNPAPAARMRVRLGARRDGTLTALEGRVWVDNGCYPFEIAGFLAYMLGSFYRVPNFKLQAMDVLTFKPSAGAYRAPGATSVVFAIDSAVDELARELQLDPIDMRLKNVARPGDQMAKDEDTWPAIGMREVLEALRDHPAWQNREQARAQGRGVGVSVGGWPGGTEPAAAACSLHRDGTLQVHVGSVDLQGSATGMVAMAAEAFGLPADKVKIVIGDTQAAPYSGASAGSKVTFSTGAAVVAAAREAQAQVFSIAADMLEASVDDLEIADGRVQVRGVPGRAIQLDSIARKTMEFGGKYAPVFAQGRAAQKDSAPAFSAQLAEVEVDRETGDVRVHRLVVTQDVGRAINPLLIEGQMRGGATQGVGWALFEQLTYDAQGQLLSGTWMDYAVPRIDQAAPVIETVIVEVPSETGPFGVRGVGEAPVVPTAAAIANAVADATGARLSDLPMRPPAVLAALRQGNGGRA